MNSTSDTMRPLVAAVILAVVGGGIILYPFYTGNQNGMMVAFALTIGAFFVVAAIGVASQGVAIGEIVPFKRG